MERRLEDGTIVTFSYEKIGGATHVYVLDVDVPQAYGSAYTLIVAPEHTLIVACTEAQDWSIEVDAEDYGFDISYPVSVARFHGEKLKSRNLTSIERKR